MKLTDLKSALRQAITSIGITLLPKGDALSGDFDGIVADINFAGSTIKNQVRNTAQCIVSSTFNLTFSLKAPSNDVSEAEDLILDELDKLKSGFPALLTTLNTLTNTSNDLVLSGIDTEIFSTESSDTYLAATISLTITHLF